ncbi:MAG: DNA alkylation repair protein [Fibrobacter sp.]|nr:DNA alkylation repair protein [Fibrobacter sp.]
MHKLTQEIQNTLKVAANDDEAKSMRRSMREQFDFLGIKAPKRRELLRETFKANPPEKAEEIEIVIKELWQLPYREMQYAASDYLFLYRSMLGARHINLIKELVITRSWWDTVDTLATRSIGDLALRYKQVRTSMDKWIRNPNLWIRRSALLYQLRYREYTDWDKLQAYCLQCAHEEDFYIRKAIGWALREYGKINPIEVKRFALTNDFSTLTTREALKNI